MQTQSGPRISPPIPGQTQTEVLILDGDLRKRQHLRECLRGTGGGYAIREASTMQEAVDALQSSVSAPGLILVDLDLGTASGLDLLGMLDAQNPCGVVFVSDAVETCDLEALFSAGADDLVARQNLTPAALHQSLVRARARAGVRIARASELRLLRERATFEGHLLGMVGHDLRTPLSSLLMSLDSLSVEDSEAPCLDIAKRSAERIRDMADQLLDLTRVRARSSFPIKRTQVPLGPLLTQIVQEHRVTSGRQLLLHAEEAGSGWMDKSAIGQLVSNLVANALAYGDAAHPVVVDATEEGGFFVVGVRNKGTLESDSAHEDIFDPFIRGGKGDGLGLGLYIVRSIIDSHEGTLEVSCANDETRFVARWPTRWRGPHGEDERPTFIPPHR